MRLAVRVVPKSSKDRIVGWIGEALKICVRAPPERGKANEAVTGVLADALGLPRQRVQIVAGHASARKIVEIDLETDEVTRLLPERA